MNIFSFFFCKTTRSILLGARTPAPYTRVNIYKKKYIIYKKYVIIHELYSKKKTDAYLADNHIKHIVITKIIYNTGRLTRGERHSHHSPKKIKNRLKSMTE